MSEKAIATIMLVEDNLGDARLLREMLKDLGLLQTVLVHAPTMLEAERRLGENAVDVILLDLGLPDANGLEAVRRMLAAAPRIPLVVLTGLDDETLASQALKQGAQDYHIKGQTEARGLLRALRYAVERKSLEEELFLEKERALVTLNSIGDAVACTDISGNLTFLNRVGENLTGWSWPEVSGRPMADVLRVHDASDRDAISSSMAMAMAVGRDGLSNLTSHSVLVRRDGSEIPIEDTVAPIRDRNGLATGAVVVLRDVSASRAMALEMARSAAELAKQNTRLNRVNGELAAIMRSSPIAVFATDPEGVVTMWSPAAERLSGFGAEQAIGVFLPIVPKESVEDFRNRVRLVSEGEAASKVELNGQKIDGAMVELSLSMAPLTDETGVARGTICLAENVTEAVSERRNIARLQSDFVATVSHELRTPLTSIGGSLALIAGGAVGPINDRAARLVEIASSNAQRLIRLVNDILDIEKLQSGKMVFRFEDVNLDVIVEQAIAANAAYAETLGVEIRRLGEASNNIMISADVDRVHQAITNILSNAAKFSPPNSSVEISTTCTNHGARVTVSDRGSGISEQFRTRIFERFAQSDTSDHRTKGGSGLGLSIVRKIMERHGGTVSFEDNPGGGTCFHLDFHAIPARVAWPLSPTQSVPRESFTHVLPVEPAIVEPIEANSLARGDAA